MAPQKQRTPFWVTFIVVSVATASFALMQSMTVPVLPRIETEMHTDQTTVTWVLTAYLLSASVFTPIVGRVGDAVGKERMLVFSLSMLCVGSVIAALSTSIGVLIAARVVQGIGGGVLPLSFGIIRDEFPHHKVASAVSFVSSLMAVGFGAGIVLGGPIVESLGYHWLFWLPAIVTALAGLATLLFVPESPVRTPGRVPVLPAVLLVGLARRAADRDHPGSPLGLGVAAGVGARRHRTGARGGLGDRGDPGAGPAGRHADDAPTRGVDDEPGRAAGRCRHVRGVRVHPAVQPDPDGDRLRASARP